MLTVEKQAARVVFIYRKPDGTLTMEQTSEHIATIDAVVWMSHLIEHGWACIGDGIEGRIFNTVEDKPTT